MVDTYVRAWHGVYIISLPTLVLIAQAVFFLEHGLPRISWWRGGATVGRWTCDQEDVGSIPGSGCSCETTVGKSLTPACPAPLKLRPYGAIQISILYYYYYYEHAF